MVHSPAEVCTTARSHNMPRCCGEGVTCERRGGQDLLQIGIQLAAPLLHKLKVLHCCVCECMLAACLCLCSRRRALARHTKVPVHTAVGRLLDIADQAANPLWLCAHSACVQCGRCSPASG